MPLPVLINATQVLILLSAARPVTVLRGWETQRGESSRQFNDRLKMIRFVCVGDNNQMFTEMHKKSVSQCIRYCHCCAYSFLNDVWIEKLHLEYLLIVATNHCEKSQHSCSVFISIYMLLDAIQGGCKREFRWWQLLVRTTLNCHDCQSVWWNIVQYSWASSKVRSTNT